MHRGSSGSVSAKEEFSGTGFAIISGISPLEGCSSNARSSNNAGLTLYHL